MKTYEYYLMWADAFRAGLDMLEQGLNPCPKVLSLASFLKETRIGLAGKKADVIEYIC